MRVVSRLRGKRPLWQRAKVIRTTRHPEAMGMLLWVDGSTVDTKGSYGVDTNEWSTERSVLSNLLDDKGPIYVLADVIELLPEFAEEVERVDYRQALAEARALKREA